MGDCAVVLQRHSQNCCFMRYGTLQDDNIPIRDLATLLSDLTTEPHHDHAYLQTDVGGHVVVRGLVPHPPPHVHQLKLHAILVPVHTHDKQYMYRSTSTGTMYTLCRVGVIKLLYVMQHFTKYSILIKCSRSCFLQRYISVWGQQNLCTCAAGVFVKGL